MTFNLPCHQAKTCGAVLNCPFHTPQPIRQRVLSGFASCDPPPTNSPTLLLVTFPFCLGHTCAHRCLLQGSYPIVQAAAWASSSTAWVPAQSRILSQSRTLRHSLFHSCLLFSSQHEKYLRDFPGSPGLSIWLPIQEKQVQSLDGEGLSHTLQGISLALATTWAGEI